MAEDKVVREYDIQPVEGEGDTIKALRVQQTQRTVRKSSDGRVLDYGFSGTENVGEPLEIPINKLPDFISDLVGWATYFASGQAARDR